MTYFDILTGAESPLRQDQQMICTNQLHSEPQESVLLIFIFQIFESCTNHYFYVRIRESTFLEFCYGKPKPKWVKLTRGGESNTIPLISTNIILCIDFARLQADKPPAYGWLNDTIIEFYIQ